MLWVIVFGGIALVALVMAISYTVWLAHKAADVMSEVGILGQRLAQLGELLAEIHPPAYAGGLDDGQRGLTVGDGDGTEDQT